MKTPFVNKWAEELGIDSKGKSLKDIKEEILEKELIRLKDEPKSMLKYFYKFN